MSSAGTELAPSARLTTEQVVDRALGLMGPGRRLLGLVGAPGAGKSTVAFAIAAAGGSAVQVVEMDGFHLADSLLVRLGRRDRKGAIDTFDAEGYVELLRRIRHVTDRPVYAPEFDREIDQGVVGAIEIRPDTRLVVTTGNYLLAAEPAPWPEVRTLLDQTWFLEPDEPTRVAQLIARHVRYGKEPGAAETWVATSDERNAALVRSTAHRSDLVVRLVRPPS